MSRLSRGGSSGSGKGHGKGNGGGRHHLFSGEGSIGRFAIGQRGACDGCVTRNGRHMPAYRAQDEELDKYESMWTRLVNEAEQGREEVPEELSKAIVQQYRSQCQALPATITQEEAEEMPKSTRPAPVLTVKVHTPFDQVTEEQKRDLVRLLKQRYAAEHNVPYDAVQVALSPGSIRVTVRIDVEKEAMTVATRLCDLGEDRKRQVVSDIVKDVSKAIGSSVEVKGDFIQCGVIMPTMVTDLHITKNWIELVAKSQECAVQSAITIAAAGRLARPEEMAALKAVKAKVKEQSFPKGTAEREKTMLQWYSDNWCYGLVNSSIFTDDPNKLEMTGPYIKELQDCFLKGNASNIQPATQEATNLKKVRRFVNLSGDFETFIKEKLRPGTEISLAPFTSTTKSESPLLGICFNVVFDIDLPTNADTQGCYFPIDIERISSVGKEKEVLWPPHTQCVVESNNGRVSLTDQCGKAFVGPDGRTEYPLIRLKLHRLQEVMAEETTVERVLQEIEKAEKEMKEKIETAAWQQEINAQLEEQDREEKEKEEKARLAQAKAKRPPRWMLSVVLLAAALLLLRLLISRVRKNRLAWGRR